MSTSVDLGPADPAVLAAAEGWGGRLRRGARHPLARWPAGALLTLVGVSILVFVVLHVIPGNQITASLGTETGILTPEQLRALEHYYGIDRSLPAQYFSWLGSILTGNLGYSLTSGQSVASLTASALPVTFELALLATLIGSVGGILLGLLAASKPNGIRDTISQGVGLAGLAVPSFVLATAIISVLADRLHYFPNGAEYRTPLADPWMNFQQMIFPALGLGFGVAAPVMRTTRSAILEISSRDFVRTARGKGLSRRRIAVRQVLHNALIPIVTITGIQFGYLLGGAVIVEQIFALPGPGRQVLNAILQREYATVQSTVLVIATAFVLVNLLTDLLYRLRAGSVDGRDTPAAVPQEPVCREVRPPLEELLPRHAAACHVARRQVTESRAAHAEGDRR